MKTLTLSPWQPIVNKLELAMLGKWHKLLEVKR